MKICKQYFGFTSDLYTYFCNIPTKESVYFKNVDVDLYDLLESGIRKYADLGKIAVLGDLNAHTGVLDDRMTGIYLVKVLIDIYIAWMVLIFLIGVHIVTSVVVIHLI